MGSYALMSEASGPQVVSDCFTTCASEKVLLITFFSHLNCVFGIVQGPNPTLE